MESTAALAKLKVADLKKELKSRGLSITGNKNELVERLQEAMGIGGEVGMEGGEEEFDEAEILGEEEMDSELTPQEEEAALEGSAIRVKDDAILLEPVEKKKISLKRTQPPPAPSPPPAPTVEGEEGVVGTSAEDSSTTTTTTTTTITTSSTSDPPKKIIKLDGTGDKIDPKARAERFGVPPNEETKKEARLARFGPTSNGAAEGAKKTTLSDEERKIARAARFGITNATSTTTTTTASAGSKISMEGEKVEIDRLKKRAERFGEVTSPALLKMTEDDKKTARMKRFGGGVAEDGAKKTDESEPLSDALAKRKERFGVVTASDEDEKKRKRAERFAI